MTLYDATYLYLKLASDVLKEPGMTTNHITNGTYMCQRAKNYHTHTRKYCYFVIILKILFQHITSQLLCFVILHFCCTLVHCKSEISDVRCR